MASLLFAVMKQAAAKMFPCDWDRRLVTSRKRRCLSPTVPQAADEMRTAVLDSDVFAQDFDVRTRVVRALNASGDMPATLTELNLDTLLSSIPYKNILCSLYTRDAREATAVPLVTRAYDESFMREPLAGERACAAGALCECHYVDLGNPFTAVEFLLPEELPAATPALCVLCSRKVTQKLFYDVLLAGQAAHATIQRHGNLCGPGEYAQQCMLLCPPQCPLQCMPLPIMSHQRSRYAVQTQDGVRSLRQLNVTYEDFCNPLTQGQT